MSHTHETEREFPIHSANSAPEATRETLQWYHDTYGMVPGVVNVMATSPALLLSYWQTQLNLMEHSGFTPAEINIVQTTVAHENECQYCVSAHTAFGGQAPFNNTDEQFDAIRTGVDFEDERHGVLRDFTVLVLSNKGRMSTAQLNEFLDAGYTREQAFDVVACIAAKVMTNYMNQIALVPVDEAFSSFADGLPYHEERTAVAAQ